MNGPDDEPVDAERWLYLHEDSVVGAERVEAVDLIERAGLTPQVTGYRGVPAEAEVWDAARIRLLIGDDGKVRVARSG